MSDKQKDNKDISVTSSQDDFNFKASFSTMLKNEHHSFVVQKTEKLASALYMVTTFIAGDDPLKTRLRTCALELVTTSTDPEKARNMRYHEGFASRCLEIGSILSLAQRAGFVSSMNARVLCDEYAELASFVEKHNDKVFRTEPVSIEADDALASATNVTRHTPPVYAVGTTKKDTTKDIAVKKTNNDKRHSNRRDIILSLFNKKDNINVKDAVQAIEGCSEKTIQRELLSLVSEGVLLKEGERRWSTYRKA